MCVVEKILKDENTVFHSYMKYNSNKKCFEMKPYNSNKPGIYLILEQDQDTGKVHIHKVGMADGTKGFSGRLPFYWRDNNAKYVGGERTTKMIHRVMTSELEGAVLLMYIHPIPYEHTSYCGIDNIKKPLVNVRDFERTVSILAKSEGHPMKLSSQH